MAKSQPAKKSNDTKFAEAMQKEWKTRPATMEKYGKTATKSVVKSKKP